MINFDRRTLIPLAVAIVALAASPAALAGSQKIGVSGANDRHQAGDLDPVAVERADRVGPGHLVGCDDRRNAEPRRLR